MPLRASSCLNRRPQVTWTQEFNAENRLASISNGTDTWTFTYDGDGNRVKQVNPDGSISLFLGGGSYEVRDAAGSPQVLKYYAVAGQRLAMMDGTTTRYLLTDHLGSVVAILDDSGNLVNAQEQRYMPFGEERFAGGITETDFGYTGQRALEAVGLMDYNARFYDAALGRFMSADNLVIGAWNPQAFNRYAYVSNNPVNYADPTGHWMVEDEGGDKLGCSLKKYCDEDYKAQPIKPSVRRTEKPGVRRLEKPAVGGLEKPGSQWSEKPKSNTPSWVAGVSGTGCIAPNCAAAGLEVLGRKDPMGKDDDYAIYDYSGWGSGGIGLASFSLYGGPVWNVKDPSDYAGKFNSVGFNVSLGDFGLTGSYFWQGDTENPFEAGIVKGFVIGYSPGAQISGWQMITDYTERFSDWD
jgi:RHS repeat-associated protein